MFENTHVDFMKDIRDIVADTVPSMLAFWDNGQICRYANAAYQDWFGKTKEELIGKLTLAELLGEELYALNEKYVLGALAGEVQKFERDIQLPNGEIKHTLAEYIPYVENQKQTGFIVQVVDVTELKKLELENARATWIISEQNSRLINLSRTISHDLKSYATGFSEGLKYLDLAETEAERKLTNSMLQRMAQQFSATITNLRYIVSNQSTESLPKGTISILKVAQNAAQVLATQISESEAEIIYNISEDMLLNTNHAYLESIFTNLISNSIKYKHAERKPKVEISAQKIKGEMLLNFSDNGRGIDLERHKSKIFNLNATFHGNENAQGIGLFLVKYHVVSLGGSIEVKSKVNEGTQFTITLP